MVKKLNLQKKRRVAHSGHRLAGQRWLRFSGNQWRIGGRGGRIYWARILAFVTGMVDQELLARNEYLGAENRILKAQARGRLKLTDAEQATLGDIGHQLGRKVLGEVANVARPDTILAWYRKLVARKFDGSKAVKALADRGSGEKLST